jgi:cytochrome c
MSPAAKLFLTIVVLASSMGLSFVHPWGNVRSGPSPKAPLLEGTTVPPEVRHVLESKCADCHSDNTHWPTYSRFAPGSWLIERDVQKGRAHLDLSQWQRYDQDSRIDLLARIASEARSGEMPEKQYLLLHPGAKLSPAEQQLLYDWARSERKLLKHQAAALQEDSTANLEPKPNQESKQ